MLASLFRSRPNARAPRPAVPAGERVYAVGDIHGRLDLLDDLIARIDADDASRGPATTTLVFLGDLVDRGPDSAGVVARLRALAAARPRVRLLLGNHEEVFLATLDGDEKALRLFCRIGGRETALSYGVAPEDYERADYDELAAFIDAQVSEADRAFLRGFENMVVIGDYAFVHAGIDPGNGLDAQSPADLRWIRGRFLDHKGRLEKVIVHGHTINEEVRFLPHRIGVDTGAFETGRLSALGLEGEESWVIQTGRA
jgi:serine/threonine protein phosphatase 1